MSRSRWFTVAVVALVAAPLALAGVGMRSAHHKHMGHHGDPEARAEAALWMIDKVLDDVDATPEQKDNVEGIIRDAFPKLRDLHERHDVLRDQFHAAMDDGADPAQIEELRVRAVDLVDEGSQVATSSLLEVRAELTDAQWAELQELRERFHGRRGF